MKLQSTIFVLFLSTTSFFSTRSWAQSNRFQPITELEASQDAHRLGQEVQRNQPAISEAQKRENHSTNAMHWTAVGVKQPSQSLAIVNQQPINTPKSAPAAISNYQQVNKPITTIEKPGTRSL